MFDKIIKPVLFAALLVMVTVYSVNAQAAKFSKDYFFNIDVISVYDGDTFTVEAEVWPQHIVHTKIRLFGIDTPETTWRAKCDKEKALGIVAREYVKNVFNNAKLSKTSITVTRISHDKYAGRYLAKVFIGNIDLSQDLIDKGYAVEYFGKGAKKDWCL